MFDVSDSVDGVFVPTVVADSVPIILVATAVLVWLVLLLY